MIDVMVFSVKRKLWVFVVFTILFLSSCEKEIDKSKYHYLLDYSILASYTPEQINNTFFIASKLYPELDTLQDDTDYGVDVFRVIYQTHFRDEPITASSLVCIPRGETLFPMVSFQNGTNTCHFNAPSENYEDFIYTLIALMAGNGYIITVPDYIGFGESDHMLHPYMHRESSNNSVIDLLKATRDLLKQNSIESGHNGDLYLMGYSQGGWASLSVLDYLEDNPIPGFYPVATACGAGAYDLLEMAQYISQLEEYPTPFFIPYFIESRRQNEIMEVDLGIYFNEPYVSSIPGLFDGNYCNSEINSEFTASISDFFTLELIEHFEDGEAFLSLREELTNNSVIPWNLQSKLHLYHSIGDNSIPYTQTEKCYNEFLGLGASSELITLSIVNNDTLDHDDAVLPWGIEVINWFKSVAP